MTQTLAAMHIQREHQVVAQHTVRINISFSGLQVDMKSLATAASGYLDPAYADGAAIADASYTGEQLALSNVTAYAIPAGVVKDPTGSVSVVRTAQAGARAMFDMGSDTSAVQEAVRSLYRYSKPPSVVGNTVKEKRGVKQVRCRRVQALDAQSTMLLSSTILRHEATAPRSLQGAARRAHAQMNTSCI